MSFESLFLMCIFVMKMDLCPGGFCLQSMLENLTVQPLN